MRWLILVVMSSEVGTLALSAEQDAQLDALSKEYTRGRIRRSRLCSTGYSGKESACSIAISAGD